MADGVALLCNSIDSGGRISGPIALIFESENLYLKLIDLLLQLATFGLRSLQGLEDASVKSSCQQTID